MNPLFLLKDIGVGLIAVTKAAISPVWTHFIKEAALAVDRTLQDNKYLASWIKNGLERMRRSGGSIKIANYVANYL